MTHKIDLGGIESAPRWILTFLGAYLAVDLLVLYLWNAAGQAFPMQASGDSSPSLSVTAMACVDLWLCLVVLRSFRAGAPLRPAWMLITLAAGSRAASGIFAPLLGANWLLNPLVWSGHADPGLLDAIRYAALFTGGPVALVLLAAAMLAGLRILRKYGFWARPHAADWALCAVVCLFVVCRFVEAGAASLAGRQIAAEDWIALAGLPVLCVLILEAALLRQSVARMGNGLISQCWAAFMYGIFLTGFGELALWVVPHYTRTWPMATVESLLRCATAAVFALAPACQVAAQRRATKPAGSQPADLATGVPALAR